MSNEQALSTVVKNVDPSNFPVDDFEPIDVSVTIERRTVHPFAVQLTKAISDDARVADGNVQRPQTLLHPICIVPRCKPPSHADGPSPSFP